MVKDDLYRVIGEKDEEIISLRNENNKLKSQIAKLQKKNTELRKRLNIPDAEDK
jgi:cell division protein FtsB